MGAARISGGASLFVCLWLIVSPVWADEVDDAAFAWAYGTIVDSITVVGNKSTKGYVALREMETRPGDVLDKRTIRRDIRLITDLSPFARVEVRADSLAPGHSALRLRVTERSWLFLKSALPFFKYNFESGLTYGFRIKDKNFRGRLEEMNLAYTRNERQDEEVSLSWSAPWVGWRHFSLGAQVAYYRRGDVPIEIRLLERTRFIAFVGVPLTESRIRFSQFTASLAFARSRNGARDEDTSNEVLISPSVGYRFDSRDSRLRPERGQVLGVSLGANYPTDGSPNVYYAIRNQVRAFFRLGQKSVIAAMSNLTYRFGDFPDFTTIKLGGSGTLRGHDDSRFSGVHRWFQTLEYRYQFVPKKIVRLPIVKQVDFGLGFVTFIDGGIVWTGTSDFDSDHYHGTAGAGIRFYSPLRDVARIDFGFNLRGDSRVHFGTGIRF